MVGSNRSASPRCTDAISWDPPPVGADRSAHPLRPHLNDQPAFWRSTSNCRSRVTHDQCLLFLTVSPDVSQRTCETRPPTLRTEDASSSANNEPTDCTRRFAVSLGNRIKCTGFGCAASPRTFAARKTLRQAYSTRQRSIKPIISLG